MMKFSEAVLKGYMTNGGRQCVYMQEDDAGAMCVAGAYLKGVSGNAFHPATETDFWKFHDVFREIYGASPVALNNDGMPWEHIYGMAVAAGL